MVPIHNSGAVKSQDYNKFVPLRATHVLDPGARASFVTLLDECSKLRDGSTNPVAFLTESRTLLAKCIFSSKDRGVEHGNHRIEYPQQALAAIVHSRENCCLDLPPSYLRQLYLSRDLLQFIQVDVAPIKFRLFLARIACFFEGMSLWATARIAKVSIIPSTSCWPMQERPGRGGHVRISSGFVGASGERSKIRWRPMYSGASTREREETIALVEPTRFHCHEVVAGWSISTRPATNSRPDAATGDNG